MIPSLNKGRGTKGAVRVNQHTVAFLREGTSLLFDPLFLRRAGWDITWMDGSMQVTGIARMQNIERIHLVITGWKYPKIVIDSCGCFVYEQGSIKVGNGADSLPCLLATIRMQDGQSLCPWCDGRLAYARGGVDWCNNCCTSETGAIPGIESPLWVSLPENQETTWESYGEFPSYGHWHG